MKQRRGINILSFAVRPLMVALLIFSVFGLVYLRSSFLKLEYSLGDLEKKKMNYLRERKILLAEKTKLLSFAKLETPYNDREGFFLPDRTRVVHVTKQAKTQPYKASLKGTQLVEP